MAALRKNCERCGAEFERPKDYSSRQWDERRFCSRSCGNRAPSKYSDPLERFSKHVMPEPNSGCWLWLGTESAHGYGQIRINGKWMLAHRLSHEIHKGSIPEGASVLHHCDNRLCVNPDHIYPGSAADNVRDMVSRQRNRRGSDHGHAKMTESNAREILASTLSNEELGQRFGVSRTAVYHVRIGKTWKHA